MVCKFSRRDFLKTSILGVFTAKNSYSVSFTDREKLSKIELQLYTVRKKLEQNFSGTLAKVAAIDYKEVEFASYLIILRNT